MKIDDLVKIGELLLNKGKYNNQQVVSEHWVNDLFSAANKVRTLHGLKDSMVGFCWYQAKYNDQIVNYAAGYGGQFLFIFSDLNAVIAVNHNHDTAMGIEQMIAFAKKDFPLLIQKINSDECK
jgi:CubicO group peptidase (beta-lactamase class C family)